EAAPRWSLGLYWRRDGKPVWRNAGLIARMAAGAEATAEDARRFAAALAAMLELPATHVQAAYEDPALLRRDAAPADTPAGFVLPLQRWRTTVGAAWVSELWEFCRGRLFLIPGDSPLGYRLPLDSLPPVPPAAYPHVIPADPFAERGALPEPDAAQTNQTAPAQAIASHGPVRTALTVEVRDGQLSVFMPPLERFEDYLELI